MIDEPRITPTRFGRRRETETTPGAIVRIDRIQPLDEADAFGPGRIREEEIRRALR